MLALHSRRLRVGVVIAFAAVVALLMAGQVSGVRARPSAMRQIVVPGEDRFTPFAITIHAGDTVRWVNQDTDDHTVVSDDVFDTAGHQGTNVLLPGTDSNGGNPGTFMLTFQHAGTFVYYCRFHAHLDAAGQPAAPGPRGGIQDGTNFGTPMMGVITVLPDNGNGNGNGN
jgi:plastocyanin